MGAAAAGGGLNEMSISGVSANSIEQKNKSK